MELFFLYLRKVYFHFMNIDNFMYFIQCIYILVKRVVLSHVLEYKRSKKDATLL